MNWRERREIRHGCCHPQSVHAAAAAAPWVSASRRWWWSRWATITQYSSHLPAHTLLPLQQPRIHSNSRRPSRHKLLQTSYKTFGILLAVDFRFFGFLSTAPFQSSSPKFPQIQSKFFSKIKYSAHVAYFRFHPSVWYELIGGGEERWVPAVAARITSWSSSGRTNRLGWRDLYISGHACYFYSPQVRQAISKSRI